MTRPIILAGFHRVVLAPKILAVAVTMFSAAIGGVDPRARFCKDGCDTPKPGKKSLLRLLVVGGFAYGVEHHVAACSGSATTAEVLRIKRAGSTERVFSPDDGGPAFRRSRSAWKHPVWSCGPAW